MKLKEVESISWAFSTDDHMRSLTNILQTFTCTKKYTCRVFIFIYFILGIIMQCILLFLISFDTVENRATDIATYEFYFCILFIFSPMFLLTFFIYNHMEFLKQCDLNHSLKTKSMESINDLNEKQDERNEVLCMDKFELRQKYLDKYRCQDRLYQILITGIFSCAVFLVLLASLDDVYIDTDFYLYSQFDSLFFLFVFLLLLFIDNTQSIDLVWECKHCGFDANSHEVDKCRLCGRSKPRKFWWKKQKSKYFLLNEDENEVNNVSKEMNSGSFGSLLETQPLLLNMEMKEASSVGMFADKITEIQEDEEEDENINVDILQLMSDDEVQLFSNSWLNMISECNDQQLDACLPLKRLLSLNRVFDQHPKNVNILYDLYVHIYVFVQSLKSFSQ